MAFDPASYLAALVDGEGTIGCYKTVTGHARRISICNTDMDIVCAAERCFKALGIPCIVITVNGSNLRPKHWKQPYRVDIRGGMRSFERFATLVPIQSKQKQAALSKLLDSRKWKLMPDREWFIKNYCEGGLSISELAARLKCAPMTAYNWLRRYDIPRRSLSLAGKMDWEKRGMRRR